jgi:hypothetical protein
MGLSTNNVSSDCLNSRQIPIKFFLNSSMPSSAPNRRDGVRLLLQTRLLEAGPASFDRVPGPALLLMEGKQQPANTVGVVLAKRAAASFLLRFFEPIRRVFRRLPASSVAQTETVEGIVAVDPRVHGEKRHGTKGLNTAALITTVYWLVRPPRHVLVVLVVALFVLLTPRIKHLLVPYV